MSIFLFFIFFWQIVGFVGYFEFSHYNLKKELKTLLKKGVPHNELLKFQFTKVEISDLIWIKKNEFSLNGSLYDVVWRKNIENGRVEFECISDKKETILFSKLNQTISYNLINDTGKSNLPSWIKLLKAPFFSTDKNKLELIPLNDKCSKKEFSSYSNLYSSAYLQIETPPPNPILC